MGDEEVAHQAIVHGGEETARSSYVDHVPEAQLPPDVSPHDSIHTYV
jgi:hypothetical protein